MNKLGKVLASTVKHRGAQLFNDKGEMNAASKKDALAMLATAAQALSSGADLVNDDDYQAHTASAAKVREEHRQILSAMMADQTGEVKRRIGAEIAGTVNTTISRMGFMRQLLKYETLVQGQRPEITVQDKNTVAAVLTGPTQVQLQVVKDPFIVVPEVSISARPYIETRVLNTARNDVLQEKFDEALENILVQEDKLFKNSCDQLVTAMDQVTLHTGNGVTPAVVRAGLSGITDFNLTPTTVLFASNLFTNLITSREWENLIEPVTRLEILRTGRIGTLYGLNVMTDGVREKTQKVLNNNEIYFFGEPQFLGEYTDRGGVTSVPIGPAETGINGAGWHINEELSQAVVNHRAVHKTIVQ